MAVPIVSRKDRSVGRKNPVNDSHRSLFEWGNSNE
ncbi:hypothetical protein CCACVL1_00853 [Corchorus capsularis]|uniref:Uncharacterized protein n=1 Tax=Corchorus capsularis TaxID=210143 RepID=A0A1R3KU38_COCAP|nr:hypothetical protein CCACVL1_00853 [Corchorus capsularis]